MIRHHFIRAFLRRYETDPKTQYHFHFVMAYFWLFMSVPCVIIACYFPNYWLSIGVLYTAIVSNYANFDTDYGAMSAAEAAMNSTPSNQEIIDRLPVNHKP